MDHHLIVRQIGQLLTMDGTSSRQAFRMIEKAAMVVQAGHVVWVGEEDQLPPQYTGQEIFLGGALVSPGLIDAHTHLIYAGDRSYEVKLRAEGRTYLEILEAGGGILSTVKKTREASDNELLDATRRRLAHALTSGTTTLEMKSGYDLTAAGELRLLRLMDVLREEGPWRILPTALAAHAVPPEFQGRGMDYLNYLIEEYLPHVGQYAEVVDIFCEPGVFSIEESRHYLKKAQELGLRCKLHIDELADGGGAFLASELHAQSADHCAFTSAEGFMNMHQSGVVAVILPGTARYLNHGHMANARAMLDAGGWVAIGSDGNPGSSPTDALSALMPWAASWLKMTPEEVWTGVTCAGAIALGVSGGSIAVGASADFLVWDIDHYAFPTYYYGTNLVREVYVGGQKVVAAGRPII